MQARVSVSVYRAVASPLFLQRPRAVFCLVPGGDVQFGGYVMEGAAPESVRLVVDLPADEFAKIRCDDAAAAVAAVLASRSNASRTLCCFTVNVSCVCVTERLC
jgi:hypothetical protein